MDISAIVSSKGQITIPKQVRDALGLHQGDRVLFRVVDGRAVLARTPDFLELAASVPVPANLKGLDATELRRRATAAQVARNT